MDDAAGEAFDERQDHGRAAIRADPPSNVSRRTEMPDWCRHRAVARRRRSLFILGLKTAVATRLAAIEAGDGEAGIADLAAALQAAIADCLADRRQTMAMARFADAHGPATLVIAGGVAANKAIFTRLEPRAGKAGFALSVPPAWLCTDNAAMIAWAALERKERPDDLDFAPRPRWPLDPDAAPPPRPRGAGMRRVRVIGGGSWGSALAAALHDAGNDVAVLVRDEATVDMLAEGRCRQLADIPLWGRLPPAPTPPFWTRPTSSCWWFRLAPPPRRSRQPTAVPEQRRRWFSAPGHGDDSGRGTADAGTGSCDGARQTVCPAVGPEFCRRGDARPSCRGGGGRDRQCGC